MALTLTQPHATGAVIRMLLTAHATGDDPDDTGQPAGDDTDPGTGTDPDPDDTGTDDDTDPEPEPAAAKKRTPAKKTPTSTSTKSTDDDAPLSESGKRALDAERERRRTAAREAREAQSRADELAKKLAEYEDKDRSELEKATAAAERANTRAAAAERRVVTSEIRLAAAAAGFADPSDAVAFLASSVPDYLTDGGVDADAIEQAVTDLLTKKPHLKRPEPVTPAGEAPKERRTQAPKPDPAQGSKGGTPEVDFRNATKDDLNAELAKYGLVL